MKKFILGFITGGIICADRNRFRRRICRNG